VGVMDEKLEKEETAKELSHVACEEKINDLTDTLKRLQAEFDNYRKRLVQEQQVHDKKVIAHLLRKLLPIVDSFQHSMCEKTQGIEIIYAQLYSFLEEQGVRPIIIQVGKEKLDPYKHEVLMTQLSDLPDHTIIEEFQKGYWFHDEVLRTAKVKCTIRDSSTENN
jgi:molecular chaperone GrpE